MTITRTGAEAGVRDGTTRAPCSALGQDDDSQLDALSKHGIPRDETFSERISTRVRGGPSSRRRSYGAGGQDPRPALPRPLHRVRDEKETTGLDANKRTPGRKRGLAVDVLGLITGVVVPAAGAHDNEAGIALLQRRLARDYDHRPDDAASRVHWAATAGMLRRLTAPTPTWRDDVELAA